MMRMIISVMRWRGVVDMLGRVLRRRSAASPMMGIRGLSGASGRTVDMAAGGIVVAAIVEGVTVVVGVDVGV